MSWLQVVAVAVTIGLNALDGFDVLAISFASPGIAAEWHIDRAQLGVVLSMELLGMAIGSITLGGVADRIGRRGTILGCLVVMAFGMIMVTTASTITQLSLWRILTGLGIGGMLAVTNAATAEFANDRNRNLCVSLMAIGYPIGAVLGGKIVEYLLVSHDWRSVFRFGALMTAAYIPIVYWAIPESVAWLTHKQPPRALEKINRTLGRMGHPTLSELPAAVHEVSKSSAREAFSTAYIATTLLVTCAYFFHITTFYYVLKWIPKIVVDMGFNPSSAAGVLVWANVGGALGGALLGLASHYFPIKKLTIIVLFVSFFIVNLFGRGPTDLQHLALICGSIGFFTNGGIVGLYALFAQVFPTRIRAFGTGFAIGTGRGGAVLAPIIAGVLFQAGQPLSKVSLIMALGSLIAAGLLSVLRVKESAVVTAEMKSA